MSSTNPRTCPTHGVPLSLLYRSSGPGPLETWTCCLCGPPFTAAGDSMAAEIRALRARAEAAERARDEARALLGRARIFVIHRLNKIRVNREPVEALLDDIAALLNPAQGGEEQR